MIVGDGIIVANDSASGSLSQFVASINGVAQTPGVVNLESVYVITDLIGPAFNVHESDIQCVKSGNYNITLGLFIPANLSNFGFTQAIGVGNKNTSTYLHYMTKNIDSTQNLWYESTVQAPISAGDILNVRCGLGSAIGLYGFAYVRITEV